MSNNSQVPGTEIACELLLKVTKRIRDQTFRSLKTQDFKNHSIRSQGRRKSIVDVDFKISNSQRTHFMFSFCEWRDNNCNCNCNCDCNDFTNYTEKTEYY